MSLAKLLVKVLDPLLILRRIECRNVACRFSSDNHCAAGPKITIVGAGGVGMATAFSIIQKNISQEVCLFDVDKGKLCSDVMGLHLGSLFSKYQKVTGTSDFADTANSTVCILSAGVRGKGKSRLLVVQQNADLFKKIIPNLVKYSPKTLLVIASNPVDVMTYISLKLSGLPETRVIGTGTLLDTARFRVFIAKRLGIAPTCVHAHTIGEHGESVVPVWSSANVAGVRFADLNPAIGSETDEEQWNDVHKNVVAAARNIIKHKGYTSWAIGLCASDLAEALLRNSNRVLTISTSACGFHGIEKDVFLSLPCVVNSNGIEAVINQNLSKKEVELLQKSAKILGDAQDSVKL